MGVAISAAPIPFTHIFIPFTNHLTFMSENIRTFASHSDENGQRAIETLTTRDNKSVVAGRSYQ